MRKKQAINKRLTVKSQVRRFLKDTDRLVILLVGLGAIALVVLQVAL